jgi:cytochrome c oxidase subunit 3
MSAAVAEIAVPHGNRVRISRLGLWLFFLSESCLFGAFAAARFYMNGTHTPEELNQLLGLGLTSILLVSSLTAYRAETAIAHGNNEHGKLMLLVTMALGLIFLGGVIVEWSIAEFVPSEGFGTSFFSMTGLHASHVATGILFLGLAYLFASRGKYSADDHWGASGVVKYWHFVDVVWVFFYPTLYLVS